MVLTLNLNKDYINVGSVRTFLDALDTSDDTEDFVYFYRGHASNQYELKPSIYRNSGWIENENKMFREIMLRCPQDFDESDTAFQKLVKMQHYSMPTRLLDISENPLIALYFACSTDKEKNLSGEVLIFKVPKKDIKYYDSDTVSVLSNLAKRPSTFNINGLPIKDIKAFNSSEEIGLLLHEIKQEKPYFQPCIVPDHLRNVVCVKPKLDNPRIIRQNGAFFLFGCNNAKLRCADLPESYVHKPDGNNVFIKSREKSKILKQLRALGITKATIYPEIDHVASYIKQIFETC